MAIRYWLGVWLLTSGTAFSQTILEDSLRIAASPDTVTRPQVVPDSTSRMEPAPPGYVPTKSPGLAMVLSAILPGAGQAYNESYWKIPVFLGLGGYFVAEIVYNNKVYKDYQSQYEESLAEDPNGDPQLLALREFYKDERDRFGWYFLILYALNILDAYVDASLYDFDVGGDLSLGISPGAPGPMPGIPGNVNGLTFRLRF